MTTHTIEQLLALAPDARAAKNGKALAQTRFWTNIGTDGQSAWGECKGSGQEPYKTQVDLQALAFHCTCPSRKFPCKHGLGLLLLRHDHPELFTTATPPDWVSAWQAKRAQRAQNKATPKQAPDPAQRAKRAAKRQTNVEAGLAGLDLWLRDRIRQGLGALAGQPYATWDAPAARLVDAQAPGAANYVRDLASTTASGTGWEARLLTRFGRLHALIQGFAHRADLPPETQADIAARLGLALNPESTPITDVWRILARRTESAPYQAGLRVQRTWLYGENTQRTALILEYVFGKVMPDLSLPPGLSFSGALAFFPSAYPLRAQIVSHSIPRSSVPRSIGDIGEAAPFPPTTPWPGVAEIATLLDAYSIASAHHPWLEHFPCVLAHVLPARDNTAWVIADAIASPAAARPAVSGVSGTRQALPLSPHFTAIWHLLAISGGHPIGLCGEWNGTTLLPLTVWTPTRFYELRDDPT